MTGLSEIFSLWEALTTEQHSMLPEIANRWYLTPGTRWQELGIPNA
jgi:hypothetical protein